MKKASVSKDFSNYSQQELYQIAADVESYPQFIPLCKGIRVLERHEDHWLVDNLYGFGPIRVHFRSTTTFYPPERIEVISTQHPFKKLHVIWSFASLPDGGCRATFAIEEEFRSRVTDNLSQTFQSTIQPNLLARFEARAKKIHGR